MRIIRSDRLLNDQGQPANIGVMGSCRVHGPMLRLIEGGDVRVLACPFNAYTHTPEEARQYLNYCLGKRLIQPALFPIVFGRDEFPATTLPFAQTVADLDLIIVEISGIWRLSGCGVEMQSNYFSTNFVKAGGRPFLNWWRAVTLGDPKQAELGRELVHSLQGEAPNGCPPWKRELIQTASFHEITRAEMASSLNSLVNSHPARFLFVTHFNLPGDAAIDIRSRISEAVQAFGDDSGFEVFDPSEEIAKAGRETALKGEGKDIYHYAEEFERHLGNVILERAGRVLQQQRTAPAPDIAAGMVQGIWDGHHPAKVLKMAEDDLAGLIEEASPPEVRVFAARRLLELDPGSVVALNMLASKSLEDGNPELASLYANLALKQDPENREARRVGLRADTDMGSDALEAELKEAVRQGDIDLLTQICNTVRAKSQPDAPLLRQVEELVMETRAAYERHVADGERGRAYRKASELVHLDPARAREWKSAMRDIHLALAEQLRHDQASQDMHQTASVAMELIEAGLMLESAHETLGRIRLAENAIGEAVDAFRRCVGLKPETARHHLNLGRALHRSGDLVAAGEAFRSAIETARLADDDVTLEAARSSMRGMATPLVKIARELEASGETVDDLVQAYRHFVLAATEIGNDSSLENWTGTLKRNALLKVLELHKNAPELFEASASKYLSICPDDLRIRTLFVQKLMEERRHEEAMAHLEELIAREPDNWVHHLQLARCFMWLEMNEPMKREAAATLRLVGDNEEARAMLERVDNARLDLDP